MTWIAVPLVLTVLTLIPSSNSQGIVIPGLGNIWELGSSPFDEACILTGNPGLEPIFGTDPWFANSHCVTHQGSAGCIIEDPSLGYGMCRCNQGDDAYFTTIEEPEWEQICLGKVGAFCSTEKSWFFPDKLCTPGAYCHQSQSGQGRQVGRCQCLYGFNATEGGLCEINENIPEPERSTPPTTTTSEAPPKEAIKFPPLNLLIGLSQVGYQEECYPKPILPLNRTICNTHGGTVACLKNNEDRLQCQCNNQPDTYFDEESKMCVGRAGSYCLAYRWMLGFKNCTKNAQCEIEDDDGTYFEQGYSFGTCECLYGYKEDENGLCERDESIPDPSTARPIPTRSTSTTENPDDDDDESATDGGMIFNGINKFIIFFSVMFLVINL